MSDKTRIAVLGGGYGGVEAAKKFHKHFRKNDDVEVFLVDRNPYHTLMTELHEIAGSRTEPEAVQVSFRKIFAGTTVNVHVDDISSIDFDNNVMKSATATYEYDYLVIGTGGRPEFFGTPGVQQHSFTLWSLEDAIRIRTHVEERFREAAKEPDEKNRKRMLHFVIAGGGFTGIELAGELCERRDVLCPKYHIDANEVTVTVVEMQESILPIFPEKPVKKAMKYLEKIRCDVLLNTRIVGADEGVVQLADGSELHTDTFVWTAGIQGSEFTAKIPLTKGKHSGNECSASFDEGIHGMAGCHFDDEDRYTVGERGRILVNQHMQSVDYRNVYLVGDMIWYLEDEKVVPQIVETALQTAETAAENVIADIENKEKKKFKSNYHGFMVSIGGRYGVAHVMGMSLSGIFAMAVKHLINMHYLFGLAGINAVWEYVQEEFFHIKNERSILHGHLAWRIPVYWAVPLRLFLGYKWLREGIYKVNTGWLDPGPDGVLNPSPNNIFLPGLTDEVSAATSATPGGMGRTGYWQQSILEEALGIYEWFAQTILSLHPIIAYASQAGAVIAQVLMGICLITGTFTFLAAGVSLIMCVFFIVAGWGNVELWWYMSAAIVMLGGAGRGFGFDHYVMPAAKRWWQKRTLAKKTFLYVGEPRP